MDVILILFSWDLTSGHQEAGHDAEMYQWGQSMCGQIGDRH
jgi:hypothetical protein